MGEVFGGSRLWEPRYVVDVVVVFVAVLFDYSERKNLTF